MSARSRHDRKALKAYYDVILELSQVLGLLQHYEPEKLRLQADVRRVLDILLRVREELRRRRLYYLSDEIRDELAEIGIVVEDTAQGQRVRFRALGRKVFSAYKKDYNFGAIIRKA